MTNQLAAACFASLALLMHAQATPPPVPPSPPSGYTLVWSDEFNDSGAPNPANWTFETGFVRNQELQWYQPQNARVENGSLVIEARRERHPNPEYQAGATEWRRRRRSAEYTSASVMTRGLHAWQYGYFEMRGRIDTSAGVWPAWWTLGTTGRWPYNGEIDIMEYYRSSEPGRRRHQPAAPAALHAGQPRHRRHERRRSVHDRLPNSIRDRLHPRLSQAMTAVGAGRFSITARRAPAGAPIQGGSARGNRLSAVVSGKSPDRTIRCVREIRLLIGAIHVRPPSPDT